MIPENHYNIYSLNEVFPLLGEDQVLKIRKVSETPEDLRHYPRFPVQGRITNGSRGWLVNQNGYFEICILRG